MKVGLRYKKAIWVIKRAIAIILIVLIGGYFINKYFENKARKEAERAEAKRIEETIRASVSEMVRRTNAIDTWEKVLTKGRFRLERILTIELERLWLAGRPILFIGAIKDVVTVDKENYRIEIERSLFSGLGLEHMFMTELQLTLQCSKQKVDLFLTEHPNLFKDFGFKNGVAVVADINEIDTKLISSAEGERQEIKIGKGKCIDMIYTGDVTF